MSEFFLSETEIHKIRANLKLEIGNHNTHVHKN